MHLNEKWFLKGRKGDANALASGIGVSKHLAALLLGRLQRDDPDAAREFLQPDAKRLHDASIMKDMDRALDILSAAAAADKKTLVIGDYDVDGIMGALILCRVLGKAIRRVSHYIPHRIDDGYGINDKIVYAAHCDGVELIVTCDNGMSAHESVALAKKLGIEVIITDHHDVPEQDVGDADEGYGAPAADAVVNPKRVDCKYPFKDLCGAAVAYKLAVAFAGRANIQISEAEWDELLCYAAVATICDIVGLVDENRTIVYHGLRLLNSGIRNSGMEELIKTCGLAGRELTTYEVGHIIGPCINAAGRLDTAELSYGLFTESDPAKIREMTACVLDLNRRRQELTSQAYEAAVRAIEPEGVSGDSVIVIYMPDTHESICGIVAGRLKDRYTRPVIMFTDSPTGYLKGSGRSVDGFNLLESVRNARELLVKYGGHKMAVGITIEADKLEAFREQINARCGIDPEILVPKEKVDLCLTPEEITPALINEISLLEPFGRGNEKPVIAIKGLAIEYASLIGSKRNVVRLKLRPNKQRTNERYPYDKNYIDAVFFHDAEMLLNKLGLSAGDDGAIVSRGEPRTLVDVTFYPEINDYNGIRKVQLIIRSIRKAV